MEKKCNTLKCKPLFMVLMFLCLFACKASSAAEPDVQVPRETRVSKTPTHIVIDGFGNEAAWENATPLENFVDIEGTPDKHPAWQTRVRLLWNDEFLYVLATLEEPHVWGNIKARDAVIYENNAFEIFINPDDTQTGYVEFEINALGTLWDLRLNKPYREGGIADSSWNAQNLEVNVAVTGTLNDPSDLDSGWTAEWAIPIAEVSNLFQAEWPPVRPWRVNFMRVQWQPEIVEGGYWRLRDDSGQILPANFSVWTPQHAVDMHRPEHWGYLYFQEVP